MEEDTETEVPVFFRGICRACIKKKKELFPLFGGAKIKFGEKCFTISEILFLGGRVKTNYDDKLPKHVCRKCLTRLIEIFSFQLKCIETDLKLKAILSNYIKSPITEVNLDQSIDKDGDISIDSGSSVKKEKLDSTSVNIHDISFEKPGGVETDLVNDTENINNNNNSSSKGSISDIVVSILEDKDQQVSVSMTLTLNDKNQTRQPPQTLEKQPTIQEVKSIATEKREFSMKDNDKNKFLNHSMNELNEQKSNETEKNQGKFICTFCKNSFDTWSDLGKHIVKHKIQNNYGRLKSESPPATLNSEALTEDNETLENISNTEEIHIQNNSIDDNCENTTQNNELNKERSNDIRLSVLSEQEMPILTAFSSQSSHEDRFYCEFCPANYKYRQDVKKHIKKKHNDKYPNENKYECNICNKLFIMYWDFMRHMKDHKKDRALLTENNENNVDPVPIQYKCLQCFKLFPKFFYVRRHLFAEHNVKCTEITKNYRKIFNKQRLLKSYEKEKRGIYTCLICHKKFAKYVEIVRHRSQHHQKQPNKIGTVSRGNDIKFKNTLDNYFQKPNGKINNENELNCTNEIKNIENNTETTEINQNNSKKDNSIISNKSIDSDADNSKDLTNPTRFCCVYCPTHYARIHDLKAHLKMKHNKNLSNVNNVPTISTFELLERAPETWKCDECRIVYSSKKSLSAHLKQKHAETVAKMVTTAKPIQEINTKTGQNIFKCKLCDATFSSFFGWKTHTFTKHRNNNKNLAVTSHECPTCKKTFLRKTSLICHLKVHELSKNLNDENVNRTKPSVSNTTNTDMETESGPNNASTSSLNNSNSLDINDVNQIHKCLNCPSIFDNRSNLRRHTRVHHTDKVREYTQEKSPKHMFQCLACYKWFIANPHLKLHMKRHFSALGVTEITCSICPKTFGDSKSYSKHLGIHRAAATKTNRYCKECLTIFPNEKGYKIHMYKHK